jgi:hypothetical protein
VVTYTRKVTNTAAADKNYRVFLKVVADTRNVSGSFHTVGKSYSGDFTESGVRLLRAHRSNLGANAALLRRALVGGTILKSVEALLKNRRLGFVSLVLSALLNELVKCRHDCPPFLK